MITRFQGTEGKRRLVEALLQQALINGDEVAAAAIADSSTLREYRAGEDLIQQDGQDCDMFFIVSGSANVLINGRIVAKRAADTHVGEMALIDPTAKRSATVRAAELTLVAVLSEEDFTNVASKSPKLWRRIAVELASRLRERAKYHRQPNAKPMVFIGSSSEAISIAKTIQEGIVSEDFVVKLWTEGIFEASATTIESLAGVLEVYDFGVIVLSGDDVVESRGQQKHAPRDNAVFELGLAMGAFGRARTYIVKPRGLNIKIPSDLLGVTCLEIDLSNTDTLVATAKTACDQLRGKFSSLGPR